MGAAATASADARPRPGTPMGLRSSSVVPTYRHHVTLGDITLRSFTLGLLCRIHCRHLRRDFRNQLCSSHTHCLCSAPYSFSHGSSRLRGAVSSIFCRNGQMELPAVPSSTALPSSHGILRPRSLFLCPNCRYRHQHGHQLCSFVGTDGLGGTHSQLTEIVLHDGWELRA